MKSDNNHDSRNSSSSIRRRLFLIVGVVGLVYVMSQFFRTANGVIAKDLSFDFSLTPEGLGILTGVFFLSFAIVQIPLGMLFDRFGVRVIMPTFLLLAIAGSVIFGISNSVTELLIARIMMGCGVAPVLMGALFIFGRWADPSEFSTWMGRMVAIGSVGALLSATPLAWVAQDYSWRFAFYGAAVVTAIGAGLIWMVVRNDPPNPVKKLENTDSVNKKSENLRQSIYGLGSILVNRKLWPILAMAFVSYPVTITILGLWGAPWLVDVYGLDKVAAGNIMLWMAIALMFASIALGPIEKKLNMRKWLAISCSMTIGISLLVLAIWPKAPITIAIILVIIIGLASSHNIVLASHGRSLFPSNLAGRGMSLFAIAFMGGPFIMQSLTGLIVGSFKSETFATADLNVDAYRAVFGFLAGAIFIANLFYLRVPDSRPSHGFEQS